MVFQPSQCFVNITTLKMATKCHEDGVQNTLSMVFAGDCVPHHLQNSFLTRFSFITSSIFQFRGQHVCHFMHWNHEERTCSSKVSTHVTRRVHSVSTRMQHVCQCMKNEPSRAYYQERCHPPETPASNKQRSNMCVNSLKMNHV